MTDSKKIIIASQNPVKINSVERGFARMFPGMVYQCDGVSVPSGVADQPMSDAEALRGAEQRAKNARAHSPDANYWIGIEGGVEEKYGSMEAFAWVVVIDAQVVGRGRSCSFFLPQAVIDLIRDGKELGDADDEVFGRTNTKQQNGAVGLFTGDAVTRTSAYADAVTMALIPFKNTEYYT